MLNLVGAITRALAIACARGGATAGFLQSTIDSHPLGDNIRAIAKLKAKLAKMRSVLEGIAEE